MSPQYLYRCKCGQETTRLRKYEDRDNPQPCGECKEPMARVWTAHHAPPDGMYSYAPNIGCAENFDRKQAILDMNAERKKDGLKYKPG